MNTKIHTKEKQAEYNLLVKQSKLENMPPAEAFFDYGLDIKIVHLKKLIEDNKRNCVVRGSAKMTRDGSMYICTSHPDGNPRGWTRGFSPYPEGASTIAKCGGCHNFQVTNGEEE
jgi:hypothetical protein